MKMILLLLAVLIAAVHVAHHAGEPRHPLLIAASVPTPAAVPEFPPRPAWRIYTMCPVNRRNIPTLEERNA
jgi:hypothetical protein